MRSRLSLAILLVAGMGLAGCDWHEETGFVEVKKSFTTLAAGDILILNSAPLDLGARSSLVVQQPTGTVSIQLKHGETSRKLCEFAVRKNRVVTVTLTAPSASLRYSVQS